MRARIKNSDELSVAVKDRKFSLFDAIGNTPLVELKNLNGNPRVKILGKLEGNNPGGSVKDRPAYYMISRAEELGKLTKDKTIVEPTSGNMGIALAMIGAAKGYRVKLYMPECVSQERQRTLVALGAEVVLTPAAEGTDGAIRRARQLAGEEPEKCYMPNQFDNESNVLAHYETTGPEVFSQTKGEIDVFVAGMGTTGTLMGAGKYLKEKKSGVKIVAVEPTEGHTIQGLKNMKESIVPKIYRPDIFDEKVVVEDEEAFEMTRLLATKEGLFVGMSSGAAVAVASRVAKNLNSGMIVVILPDRGDRYLSTTLFRSFCAKCPP
ncbi:MAG: PLP-dependent cysteine synthase family protein [Dehalococcoidia bacterium]|nr:PLP-dependent cysteine synthase family protein [Dehalococcoidia bacterium]